MPSKPQMIKKLMSAMEAALEIQRIKGDGPAFDFLFAAQAEVVKDWMKEKDSK